MAATLQHDGSVQLRLHVWRLIGLVAIHVAMTGSLGVAGWSLVSMIMTGDYAWPAMAVGIAAYVLMGLGVTVYLHRYRTHGAIAFRPGWLGRMLNWALNAAALAAFQSTAQRWVFWHRWHHRHSDETSDLHSPRAGWLHAHCGWLLYAPEPDVETKKRLAQPDCIGRFMDTYAGMIVFGPGLASALAFLAAGWLGVVWYLAAACVVWHVTGCINSVCHRAPRTAHDGPNPDTGDFSRNSVVLGILGFGEGWHRNHHGSQKSARLGQHWWQFDAGYYFIWLLRLVRLVT